jgi:two-component system, NarL family, response regulator NreC
MSRTSIVLIDDHAVLRHGLQSLLEREADFAVVGEGQDGAAALELVTTLRPDVLVVDLMMAGTSGLEVIRQVRTRAPNTQILVLSMHAEVAYVREALRAGAKGYVVKEAPASEYIAAVREVARGRHYVSSGLPKNLLDTPAQQVGTGVEDAYDLLSESERAVLKLAALGSTSTEIAAQLSFSPRTVETYRSNLMHKLDLHNQTELVRYAIKRGIVLIE